MNNDVFAEEPAKLMSPITENLLRAIDYEAAKARRDINWDVLAEALSGANELELRKPDGPFMYPLMVEGVQEIRKALIEEGVYVPCLWSDAAGACSEGSAACKLAEDVLPLPLDQRYGEEEMEEVARFVIALMKRNGK